MGQGDGLNPALAAALGLLRPGGESGPLELELEVRGCVEEDLLPPSMETATDERVLLCPGIVRARVQLWQQQSHWGTPPLDPEPRTVTIIKGSSLSWFIS